MGILNVTPDSFYDGGRYVDNPTLTARVDQLLAQGADILDIGAESSRPGAAAVAPEVQLERLDTALGYALDRGALVSVDTTHPRVAEECARRGAHIINDVSCLRDPRLAEVAAKYQCWLVLMHSRSPMSEMRGYSEWPDDGYGNIVQDVIADWSQARDCAVREGVVPEKIFFDPGFGFSKNAQQSTEILARLQEFGSLGAPIVSGTSRKSFLLWPEKLPPAERLGASLAACLLSAQKGAAVVRVHDVIETKQAAQLLSKMAQLEMARSKITDSL
jgi:dihydropteroate synthase